MKPSSANGKTKRTKARNATLLNLLGTPGLGSLMAGRTAVGIAQLILAVAGFALVTIWFCRTMSSYYGQMFTEQTEHRPVVLTSLFIGGGIFAVAWVWSLFTSISLVRAAKLEEVSTLKTFAASGARLDESKILSALAALPDWKREGQTIARTFGFADFPAALKFVNAVAAIAEATQHHPEVNLRWKQVTLALTTHDVGGLTEKDFALAKQCDALA